MLWQALAQRYCKLQFESEFEEKAFCFLHLSLKFQLQIGNPITTDPSIEEILRGFSTCLKITKETLIAIFLSTLDTRTTLALQLYCPCLHFCLNDRSFWARYWSRAKWSLIRKPFRASLSLFGLLFQSYRLTHF